MKKLMIALSAAAAAFFAVGTAHGAPFSSADFEDQGYVVEAAFDASKGDDGVSTSGDRFWYSESNDGNVISGHVGEVTANVPDYYENAASNNKFLQLDTSAPLLRTVNANAQDPTAFTAQAIGDGIYLDTLVKFTAADQAFTDDLTDGDKIAISFVDHEAEEGGNDEAYTSFVIRAGYIAGEQVLETNYFATVPSGFNKDAWHRLTVRSLSGIDAAGHVGFIVYIDENPLVYAEGVTIGDEFAPSAGIVTDLNAARVLYPSAVNTDGTNFDKITCASFSGTGAIDDVVFTADKPNFIAASELVPATITLGNGISSVVVTIGENPVAPVDASANPLVFNLPAGTTTFNLAVTADTANGYSFLGIDGATLTDGVVTWEGSAPTFTVLATRNNVTYINDQDAEVECVTLSQAFANVKDGGTIKLAYDFSVANDETNVGEQSIYDLDLDKEMVLDLNGKTLDGGTGSVELFYIASGSLTVIDSVGGGKIVYGGFSIFGTEATIDIGAATGDMGPTIDGLLFTANAEGNIVRANVLASENSDQGEFLWEGSVDPDSDVAGETINGYWFVAPAGEEPPTAYAISWTVTGGATTATAGNFTEGTTIVFTAEEGKTLSFVSIDGTEIDGTAVYGADTYTYTVGTAGAELVVTFTQQIIGTYQVTVTPAENATYAAVYSDDATAEVQFENNVASVVSGKSIIITATPAADYEYATTPDGWTAGENGVITKTVSEAGTVEIPAPTAKQEPPASTWTVTLTLGEHVTSVSYVFVDTPETTNTLTATGSFTIEKGKSFALVDAVAEEGWEIDLEASLATLSGATLDPTYFFVTPTADASGSIIAKSSTPSGEDWATGDDLDAMGGKTVEATYGITGDLANVDAKVFTTWASGIGGVAYADRATTTYNVDCFLLNIANDSNGEAIAAAKATAAAAINITAITFDAEGKPVVTAPATYGNGKVVIKGKVALTDADWAAFDDSTQHFFRAELVVDEVAAQEAP